MTKRKKWSDLPAAQQRAVIAGAVAELVLTTWAARDLRHRPATEVRGPKALWAVALVVQPFGPLAYLTVGRS